MIKTLSLASERGGYEVKAISPLVATAILLVATVAGGIILYSYLVDTIKSTKEYVSLTPISAQIVDLGNNTIIVNVKVAAVGSKPTTIDSIKIVPENIVIRIGEDIEPGETKSITIEYNATLSSTVKHYVIVYYEGQATEPIQARVYR